MSEINEASEMRSPAGPVRGPTGGLWGGVAALLVYSRKGTGHARNMNDEIKTLYSQNDT